MPYRFIHTSDWHLGKKLFRESRIPEQEEFLTWLIAYLKKNDVNSLCISGDIFDTPHPSARAQTLYYEFLNEIVKDGQLEVFIISGNHDSGRFLEAPLPFLKEKNIHVVGLLEADLQGKTYSFHRDGISFHLLPYFRSHELFNFTRENSPVLLDEIGAQDIDTYKLIESLIKNIFNFKKGNKNVLLAHHLFGNGELSGSELGLSLSGLDTIPLALVKESFDYVALGHLHNQQFLSKANPVITYSGGPIAFKFSEHKNKKINQVDLISGELEVTSVDILAPRSLYELKLTHQNYREKILELIKNDSPSKLDSFLEVQISSDKPLRGVADEIRELLTDSPIKLLSLQTRLITNGQDLSQEQQSVIRDSTPEQLFEDFYLHKFSGEKAVPKELTALFNELLLESRADS